MDEWIFALGLVVPLGLTLLAVIPKVDEITSYLLAGISAMGGVVGIYVFLGIASDGDLTQTTNTGALVQLASATLNPATWNFITLIPLILALFAFMGGIVSAYRGYKKK